jgi:sterol desaturase/sphingolipid hydroxylase (fatty acid hydroxylase superfamily)
MNKNNKKQKRKSGYIMKQKPYTVKQENDIILGKVLCWCFLLALPTFGLLAWGMSWNLLLVWSIISLIFAVYNLIGLILKWDHARVCTKNFLKRTYKFDIRNDWNKENIKDSISVVVIWVIFGVIFLVGAIFH